MGLKVDIELKIRRFFRRFGKGILVAIAIFFIILAINKMFKNINQNKKPETTYTPSTPVMDDTANIPTKVQKSTEEFIDEYIKYCNNGEFSKAYEMISEDCKKDYFGSYTDYENYVKRKFETPKQYVIQSYSVYNKKYIYSVKLFDDFLATGLTNSTYRYQEEKLVASYNDNNKLVFSVGNFIEKNKMQSVQENNYLKVDVREQIVFYEYEEYKIRLTNRSDYTIIIQNLDAEDDEVVIDLGRDQRANLNIEPIILEPGSTSTVIPIFSKGYDNKSTTKAIKFTSVRVVDENEDEIDKFSMTMGF